MEINGQNSFQAKPTLKLNKEICVYIEEAPGASVEQPFFSVELVYKQS